MRITSSNATFVPIEPAPAPPEAYVLSFADGGFSQTVRFDDGLELPFRYPTNGRDPSFVVEAGKPFYVVADDRVRSAVRFSDATRVDLKVWTVGEHDKERSFPIANGERDLHTGQLITMPAKVDVPEDASGTLFLSFEFTDKTGEVHSEWSPHYGAIVIPKNGATLHFGEDWKQTIEGEIQAGGRLQVAYDRDRLAAIFGGHVPEEIVACYRFDREVVEVPVKAGAGGDRVFMPAVRVPFEARKAEVWFRGRDGDRIEHDSNFGKNFVYDVGYAAPDADPHWKTFVLTIDGMTRLTKDNFVAIGPTDQRYNCIAFSLGIRNEWVWRKPEDIETFDGLYAEHGYEPLEDLDLSHDPDVDKVALFAKNTVVTHAARMDDQGRWMSKLGTDPLIRHDDVNVAGGKSYGDVVRVYVRPKR